MKKMIIEARINEYAMREGNPHVPWTAEEIAETAARCREEGASVLHFHARQADGSPDNSPEGYATIIRKVREKCDILINPTLGYTSNANDPQGRVGNIRQLGEDRETKPDLLPIMPGSVNLEQYDKKQNRFVQADLVYQNTTAAVEFYAGELREAGIKPQMVCWDVGFLRRAGLFLEMGLIDEPAYILFHLTDGKYHTGHPGTPAGVEAFLSFLPEGRRCEWTTNCLDGNVIKLVPFVARRGGHVSIGIGDYPYKELGQPTNEELIRMTVDIAKANGREIATPGDAREMLGF
jgi:3-keto-5-aminohexanoate cleavage enzyme